MKKIIFYTWIPLVVIVIPFIYGWIIASTPVITEAEKDNVTLRLAEDKCIEEAQKVAQSKLDEFRVSLSKKSNQFSFSVKIPFDTSNESIKVEHMWVTVDLYEGTLFKGKLMNDPAYVKNLKLRDSISVESNKVEDWIIRNNTTGEYTGGFSVECLNKLSN